MTPTTAALIVVMASLPSDARIIPDDWPTCWMKRGEVVCMTPEQMEGAGYRVQDTPDGERCYALPNGAEVCR